MELPYLTKTNTQEIISDDNFNWQLAGLIDGDAFINQYELSLTLHFSQVSVLYMLRERFGETVVWAPGKNAFRWRITRANELQGVAKLFIYFCFLV